MLYVGLDVHLRSSSICILDAHGKMVKQNRISGHPRKMVECLSDLKKPFSVCYEASCGYGWLFDQLQRIARRVEVAHPGHLRLIFRSKKKNDRVDAQKLAKLLFLNEVPGVYVPSVDVRNWRSLIEFRQRVIARRTQVKNGIRALLRNHGIETIKGTGLWTRKGLAWLSQQEFPTSHAQLQRDMLLDDLESSNRRVARVDQELNAIGRQHPGVHLLQTIPGVGPRTAETIMAYIDDPKRFKRNKTIGSYFGMIPSQDESGSISRMGRITRQGPATVRKMLTEAAWQAIRHSPKIREHFERVQRGDKHRRKKALVATAHYLARIMLAMLTTGEVWRGEDTIKEAA